MLRGRGLDDHSRIAFIQMYPDERKESAVSFVQAANQYFAKLGITIERVITDNGRLSAPTPPDRL